MAEKKITLEEDMEENRNKKEHNEKYIYAVFSRYDILKERERMNVDK